MSFSEALKAMTMGNYVSREIWRGKVSSWHLADGKLYALYPTGYLQQIHSMIIDDILAEDWWVVT